MAILELGLQVYQETGDRTAAALTIPEEWKKRPVVIEGARKSYYWHGKLHVHDESGMRRSSPFPAKEGGRCRVLVFGDSLTYGYGVSEEEAYPSLLERSLAGRYRLEVLNLGVSGRHSSGVLEAVKRLVPDLEPELVVYGVCLNDFLDPLEGEASNRRRHDWPFPLPEKFKREMLARTATAELLERGYDSLLMKLGLRLDFFDDILKGFDGYQVRFGSDVSEMNSFARQMGLPPVVAMTLDQFPGTDSRGREISRIAEGLMRGAGMTVVPTEQFYEEHHGRRMIVSPWEGHPNAEAHRLFADNLLEHLDGHPAIESCRIPAP
jgi:lysophospholipase L1-like esterase